MLNCGNFQRSLEGAPGATGAAAELAGDDGSDGGSDSKGGIQRTLPSGGTSSPSCTGSKYPVHGIPHFDHVFFSNGLFCRAPHATKCLEDVFAFTKNLKFGD